MKKAALVTGIAILALTTVVFSYWLDCYIIHFCRI